MKQSDNLNIDEIIKDQIFIDFVKSARDFCYFIENSGDENEITFLELTQAYLQSLYVDGQQLKYIIFDEMLSLEDRMTKPQFESILSSLANRLSKRYYWHIFDPTNQNDIDPVCGDLVDDLGDIYKDIKNALLLFDNGNTVEVKSAVWTFKWSFDNHWGDHCVNATYALHYFIQRAN
jgi:hypothetical protein